MSQDQITLWLLSRKIQADVRTLSNVLRAVYCTYPVPLHAHTHFLATVRPALVLHRVRGQTLAAALLLTGLRLAQDLRHALLMHIVQTLMNTHTDTATINANSTNPIKAKAEHLYDLQLVTHTGTVQPTATIHPIQLILKL